MSIENLLWLGGGICYGIALVLILIVLGGASERPMATFNKARQQSIRRWKIFMVGLVLLVIGSFIATGARADKPRYTSYHPYVETGIGYNFSDGGMGVYDIESSPAAMIAVGVIEKRSEIELALIHISDPTTHDSGLNMVMIKKRFTFAKKDFGESNIRWPW